MVVGYGNRRGEVEEYIEQNGYELKTYFAPSGDVLKDLTAISLWLRNHKDVNVLIVYSIDEFESEAAYHYWLYVFLGKGVDVVPVCGSDDYEFEFRLKQMDRYRQNIKLERMRNAVMMGKRAKDKNHYAKVRLPYGYGWDKDGNVVVNKERAHHVRYVFNKRKEGKTLKEVAKKMNEYGWRTEKGGKFTRDKINSWIFHNKMFYYGYIRGVNGMWIKGTHEPIVPNGFLENGDIVINDPKLIGLE